ncbi:MAG: nitrate- and nitrite sensing domain-containing protein [Pseudomonadota bacterium]
MNFIKNLKIRTRILLVAALPLAVLAYFQIDKVLISVKEIEQAVVFDEVAMFTPKLTSLITDLQAERGKTAGFLGSDPAQGASRKADLQEHHKKIDHDIEELLAAFDSIEMDHFSEEFQELAESSIDDAQNLGGLRQDVVSRSIDKEQAVAAYTRKIKGLLSIIEYTASHSKDAVLTDRFAAFIGLLEKQEAMGKERAIGTAALTSKDITLKARESLAENIGLQKAYEHIFHNYATKEEEASFQAKVKNSPNYKKVEDFRERFLDPEKSGQLLFSHSGADWFNLWTAHISDLQEVTLHIQDDIAAHVKVIHDTAQEHLIFNLAAAIIETIVVLGFVFLISNTITGPVQSLTERMKKLANDDLDFDIPNVGKGHELAAMADTLEVFKENALQMRQMEKEQEALKQKAEEEKRAAMHKLADDFDSRTRDVIDAMASSAVTMQSTATQMNSASNQTTDLAQTVAAAATEADANVQTVAAATEELSASSQEIAQQIGNVANMANTASQEASSTSQAVNELKEMADSIGDVVSAISDIAEQTNLLALNATIEAARAGAAGKGFAVVADEVKKLATETGLKTEEISERINSIQGAVNDSVRAMDKIIESVQEISHATSSVSTAVEEQNAATAEIGRNVSEASTGTQQVSQNIVTVQETAVETGTASQTVLSSADELSEVSKKLEEQVATFLSEIRSQGGSNDDHAPAEDIVDAAE